MRKICSIIILISLYSAFHVLNSTLVYAYPPGWSDDIQINNDTTYEQRYPDLYSDNQNNIWVTWYTGDFWDGEIFCSKRDSLGGEILPETNISNNVTHSLIPRVVVDDSDNAHFVWRDITPMGYGLWHTKLAPDGTTLVPSHIAVNGAGIVYLHDTEIVMNKYQEIDVVWEELPSGYYQMSYSKLDTLGNAIIERMRVSPENVSASWVGIGTDSAANNHCACRIDSGSILYRLTYAKLARDGTVLVPSKLLWTGGNNSIVCDRSQNVHIVYTNPDGPGNRIDYLKLDNDGNVLIGATTISTPTISSNTYAHMAIDSTQYLHVVWQGDSSGVETHIMYCKLDTMGDYVIEPMQLVYPSEGITPRITVDLSNRLHVAWVDGRLGVSGDIFYKRGENEPAVMEYEQQTVQNYQIRASPNPFRDRTEITSSTEHSGKGAAIRIFDASGCCVKNISLPTAYSLLSTGLFWYGTDDHGNRLPAGVYFLQVSTDQRTQAIPVILLR